jgi:3-phenylpropionate/trans-cinnamate dioxygenase ferredoxin component
VSIGSDEDPVGFVPVAASTQVKESEIIAVQISGLAVAVGRSNGTVYAVADQCSHQGCPLSTGFVEDAQIECECHGARFDLGTGEPTFLPATLPIPVYAAYESDETIFVRSGEPSVPLNRM